MDSVTNSYNEVLSELLRAEVKTWHAPDALLVACTWRKLEVLELLLKSLYSKGDPEPTMEKVFSLPNLNDTVFELLLNYCGPTPKRFRQACKAGSSVAVDRIVRLGDFDINGEDEQTGEYPLYIAASNLHADVVNVLVEHGADVQVKSSKVPLPLLAALHACVVPLLKKSQSQKVKEWSITIGRPISPYFEHHAQPSISMRRIIECERIVHLLLENGADAEGGIAGFGKPLHLACLIGSKSMVRELLNHGADVNSLLECFDQTLWNDLGRDHPIIMEVLVEYGVDVQHVFEPLRERSLERLDMAAYDVFDEISSG
ncbi:ankyrin repeat-containing domain protein [Hypoxylon sp. FL1857]|nr:ankyrin repeat-containing domain protein [Hypoxylon sp. FL1857]